MKKSDKLKLVIRKIVREEISIAMDGIISEMKSVNNTKNVIHKKPTKKKQYVTNTMLNDILNETADSGEWKTLNGSGYTTSNMGDIMNNVYGVESNSGPISGDDMVSSLGADPSRVDDSLKDALSRDYTDLIKTINKKGK